MTTPDGWVWECASCDQPVSPMGMCEVCGVFGVMRVESAQSDCTCDGDGGHHPYCNLAKREPVPALGIRMCVHDFTHTHGEPERRYHMGRHPL